MYQIKQHAITTQAIHAGSTKSPTHVEASHTAHPVATLLWDPTLSKKDNHKAAAELLIEQAGLARPQHWVQAPNGPGAYVFVSIWPLASFGYDYEDL